MLSGGFHKRKDGRWDKHACVASEVDDDLGAEELWGKVESGEIAFSPAKDAKRYDKPKLPPKPNPRRIKPCVPGPRGRIHWRKLFKIIDAI
jgi:hypothetical protein